MNGHTKPLGEILTEFRDDLKQFIDTRIQLFKRELQEKWNRWKTAVPLLCVALVVVCTAWMVLTFGLVALVHAWFLPSAYAWLWGALIVGGIYLLAAGALGWLGYKEISVTGLKPERTLAVLKHDRQWIDNERGAA